MEDSTDIFTLDDYCLENILAYLDIVSQLNFANVCRKFREIFDGWAKRHHKEIRSDVLSVVTEANKREEYFKLIGKHVLKCGYGLPDDSILLVKKYCTNVQKIYCPFWPMSLRKVALSITSLRTIHFRNYFPNVEMEESVLSLQKLPNLREISLVFISYEGKHLSELTQLEKLEIHDCPLTPENLIACFRSMKNLRVLKFDEFRKSTIKKVFNSIVNNCTNLEEFHFIARNVEYEKLAKLTKLKCLYIKSGYNQDPSNIINRLANSSLCNQLEILELPSFKLKYEDSKCLANMKSLKKLHVNITDGRCFEQIMLLNNLVELIAVSRDKLKDSDFFVVITKSQNLNIFKTFYKFDNCKQFILDAIEMLRKIRDSKNQRPLELWFAEVYFNFDGALETPEYKNARDLIRLKFV